MKKCLLVYGALILIGVFCCFQSAYAENANINGVIVQSDKAISSIKNTRIEYADGSWCDVSTGKVVNKGAGFISMGNGMADANEKKIERKEELPGDILNVRNISADLEIQPYSGNKIEVTRSGPKSQVENIRVTLGNKTVKIDGSAGPMSSVNVQTKNGGVSVSGNSNVTVNNGSSISVTTNTKAKKATKVTVRIPKGIEVIISDIDGSTVIGDTEGKLSVSSSVSGKVKAGSVRSAVVSIQSSTEVRIKYVSESLGVSIQGSGDVKVDDGNVKTCNVFIQGSGDVRYEGKAIDANLQLMGSGDIKVKYVKNRPSVVQNGSGEINVDNWPDIS